MLKFNYILITVKDQAVEGHTDIGLIFIYFFKKQQTIKQNRNVKIKYSMK